MPRPSLLALLGAIATLLATASPRAAEDEAAIARGQYLFHAGACDSCHTDHPNHGAFLAGGRRMDTEFGTFYVPNITPDETTGIGHWTGEDFRRAMIEGTSPDGGHYYPVFPYRWYTGLTEQDVADMWAYLRTVPPVRNQVREHDLPFPFNIRELLLGWKLVSFDQGETISDPERPADWNRGAYLVNHLGHCGACHTPKLFGALFISFKYLAGSSSIPGPYPAPNITPDQLTGIGSWTRDDLVRALKYSMTPHGVPIRGPMAEYVASGSSFLNEADLAAMAVYLMSIEPEEGPVSEREERLDRRLVRGAEAHLASDGVSGGGGMGASGMALLRASGGGRTRAK